MKFRYGLFCLVLINCSTDTRSPGGYKMPDGLNVEVDTVNWYDSARSRNIPVALYTAKAVKTVADQKLVIFSHGYGRHKEDDYLTYSYLTRNLAAKGFFVVSIQHELPGDSPLATTGDLRITRRSNWQRGVENILFVLNRLQQIRPELDFKQVTMIGHSNGGDMSVLFAHQHPDRVNKVITLDNQRMPWPRTSKPKIYSLRSDDKSADPGVIPRDEEVQEYGMTIVKLADTKHNEMDDDANARQRTAINKYIEQFLKD